MIRSAVAIIADLYTPLLVLVWAYSLVGFGCNRRQWLESSAVLCLLALPVLIVIVGDLVWRWWPERQLDFSTHTAVALLLVVAIGWVAHQYHRSLAVIIYLAGAVSLCAYAGIMVWMHYHTVADIVTTAVIVGVPQIGIAAFMARQR